jgi:hypothetical protein
MRQRVGEKKVKKYREMFKLPICTALARGGTDHRIDLFIEGGRIVNYYPHTKELEMDYSCKWDYSGWLIEHPRINYSSITDLDLLNRLAVDSENRKIEDDKKEKITRESIDKMEPWLRVALGYGAG